MGNTSMSESRAVAHRGRLLGMAAFLLVAIVGLYYVKWSPYYSKAFIAAAKHSIGESILSRAAVPPPASVQAAWDYTVAYTLAIWKALILGLLLGSGVQALVPREWIVRLLGRKSFGCVAAAGVASIFSMM